MPEIFEITHQDKHSNARNGVLKTAHGIINTPVFFPIGTHGPVKSITNGELINLGAEAMLANTYHLWLLPGVELLEESGGLHKFTGWQRPIFTDSGGFQVFSLGERSQNREDQSEMRPFNVEITDDGATFQSSRNGNEYLLTPEKSVSIQRMIGSDITTALDEFTVNIFDRDKVAATVERTIKWANRSRRAFLDQSPESIKQLQLGVVQGGMFEDLRKISAEGIRSINFDGYAIGGVAVGEEASGEQYRAVEMSLPHLENDKFRHLFGVGTPEQIVQNVLRGIDSFDCVIPTREARHGRLYVSSPNGYQIYDILRSDNARNFGSVDAACLCELCTNYSRAYLHYLFKIKEIIGIRLATLHNLAFYLNLMKQLRDQIKSDSIAEFAARYYQQPGDSNKK